MRLSEQYGPEGYSRLLVGYPLHFFYDYMTYSLSKLAPGSYDLYLNGSLVGGIVRNGPSARTWTAELLEEKPAGGMPKPFTEPEHRFPSLEAVLDWLCGAKVIDE